MLKKKYDVCLVSMPYVSVTRPSIALGILKSILTKAGLRVKIIPANVLFAEQIGLHKFMTISHQAPMSLMLGEWSFSHLAFPDKRQTDEQYLAQTSKVANKYMSSYQDEDGQEWFKNDMLQVQEEAKIFVDKLAEQIVQTGAKIVGCTSTFEQHVPSLALLRKLKEISPDFITMMGGANCESDMGQATHRNFPWVDYVVSGEADGIIAELCYNILAMGTAVPLEQLPKGILGPVHRKAPPLSVPRIKFNDLDTIPTPDYKDYFSTLEQSPLKQYINPGLPLETSRGCWWGAIHHCTFCGLNGNGMGFRSKSPERVEAEIEDLEKQYDISKFEVVDNILDMSYFNSLLPALTKSPKQRTLFYEVKSNLSKKRIHQLKEAGIIWVQPGIESLHSEVLELMDKGVKGWQNVQLLKWCREIGVRLSWSVLCNFPGEEEAWYQKIVDSVPFLEHLQPPNGLVPLRYDRFSVYHTKAKELGLQLTPFPAMFHVYDLPFSELNDLAYFFLEKDERSNAIDIKNRKTSKKVVYQTYAQKIKQWKTNFWKGITPILSMEDRGEKLYILDSRSCSKKMMNTLTGLKRAVLLIADRGIAPSRLSQVLGKEFGLAPSPMELEESIASLKDFGYLLEIDGRLLNLAVQGDMPSLPQSEDFPGGYVEKFPPPARKAPQSKKELVADTLIAKDLQATFKTPLQLDCGKMLPEFSLNYQVYGTLNEKRDNAILVFHSFTKNAHLAGKYAADAPSKELGWWDKMVGPGKTLDTNKYFVIGSNVLGGSSGSTSPASINPATGVPYAMDFPILTVGDMVQAQKHLVEYLGIQKLGAIVGGCFGGQQALEWIIRYPKMVNSAIVIAATPTTSAHTLAISKVMRHLIYTDPNWNNGNYYGKKAPSKGLSQSILAALPIWMSRDAMGARFGRKRLQNDKKHFTLESDFVIEKFIDEMGEKARKEFDANSLIYLARAVEYFDLPYYYGNLENAFKDVACPVLFMSYTTDWRYPSKEVNELHEALVRLGKPSEHLIFDHPLGHGAFMYAPSDCIQPMHDFLTREIIQKTAVCTMEPAEAMV